jgi:inhibitor of KinA sporulation pathway (predicted exonuclease)
MAKQLDQIVVVDLEATCWEGASPQGQMNEIIEIGLCLVDVKTLQRTEKRSILVKPRHSDISAYCTALTTLTPEMLSNAGTFEEAIEILQREYHTKHRLWASWGDYDRRQFERNCQLYDVNYPFGPTHLNVKNLFAIATGLSHEAGLDAACKQANLPMEGIHHRGDDDAWNIAGVLCHLLKHIRANF